MSDILDRYRLPELLSTTASVQQFGVSKSTLRRWLAAGRIKGKRIGRSLYFLTETVQSAVNQLPDA
jgi:excisionase family DNA binding protein